MKDDTHRILDDLLAQWHAWAKGYQAQAGYGVSPMFGDMTPSRQWDSEYEVLDKYQGSAAVQAVQHAVFGDDDTGNGRMEPLEYRIALQVNAKNLYTGRAVWSNGRLPNDLQTRAQLLGLARVELINRLAKGGWV